VISEDGSECVIYDHGTTNIDNGIGSVMEMHFFGPAWLRPHRFWAGSATSPPG
jgi:hypothetical protein